MSILVLSVTLSAASYLSRRPNVQNRALSREELNLALNAAIQDCIASLPDGTDSCDAQLQDSVRNLCMQDSQLDACHDGKVEQYYKARPPE